MPDPSRGDLRFLPLLRAWLANLVLASVDYGVSLSCGGVALLGALYFNAPNPHWWFIGGATLPLGPLGWLATSRRTFKGELAMLHELHEKGYITQAEYDVQRGRVLDARADRLQGYRVVVEVEPGPITAPPSAPEPKPKKVTKASPAAPKEEPKGAVAATTPNPATE